MKTLFENLPDELNDHIYGFVQGQIARENYAKVIEQIKDALYSQVDSQKRGMEYNKHFILEHTDYYDYKYRKKDQKEIWYHKKEMFYYPFTVKNFKKNT